MASKHSGKCPFCDEVVTPKIVTENIVRRDVCKCPSCSEMLIVCRTPGCQDYAKGGTIYDDELCPGCTASITNGAGEVLKWVAIAVAGAVATAAVSKKDD